ncbi:DUF2637 domain-containing protein [Streptomyces sp. NPDC051642]|uniref:DUF2637 domain-containing protein n=1 Tax=Streptomyces sp. NPDC051642 TaxID=3154646 RepID=UPI00343F84F1
MSWYGASLVYLAVPGSSCGSAHGLCARSDGWAVDLVSAADEQRASAVTRRGFGLDAWIRPLCALVVAGVAACASYVHQREFARQGGADAVSASLWPLSVDGLLLLATVGLLKPSGLRTRRARGAVWTAFLLGIAVSSAANVAAVPALECKPVLVAGVASGGLASVGRASGAQAGPWDDRSGRGRCSGGR